MDHFNCKTFIFADAKKSAKNKLHININKCRLQEKTKSYILLQHLLVVVDCKPVNIIIITVIYNGHSIPNLDERVDMT